MFVVRAKGIQIFSYSIKQSKINLYIIIIMLQAKIIYHLFVIMFFYSANYLPLIIAPYTNQHSLTILGGLL